MTPFALAQWAIVIGAIAVVPGYVCRLGLLNVRLHKASAIIVHLAWCGATVAAGVNGWENAAGPQDVLVIVGAGAWLLASLRTWRHGPPWHVYREQPTPDRRRLQDRRVHQ